MRKEEIMKAPLVVGLAVALSGTSLFAQSAGHPDDVQRSTLGELRSYQQCDLKKIEPRLLGALNDNIEGVVEGTLREIAKVKLAQPECTSELIEQRVNELITNGATAAVRHKAYLTSIVLFSPWAFEEEGVARYMTDEQFFTALSRKLEHIALRDEG
jgi:hypothetical protein